MNFNNLKLNLSTVIIDGHLFNHLKTYIFTVIVYLHLMFTRNGYKRIIRYQQIQYTSVLAYSPSLYYI